MKYLFWQRDTSYQQSTSYQYGTRVNKVSLPNEIPPTSKVPLINIAYPSNFVGEDPRVQECLQCTYPLLLAPHKGGWKYVKVRESTLKKVWSINLVMLLFVFFLSKKSKLPRLMTTWGTMYSLHLCKSFWKEESHRIDKSYQDFGTFFTNMAKKIALIGRIKSTNRARLLWLEHH